MTGTVRDGGRTEGGRLFCNYMRIYREVVCEIQTSIKMEGTFCALEIVS